MTACSSGTYTTQIILDNHYFQASPILFQDEQIYHHYAGDDSPILHP